MNHPIILENSAIENIKKQLQKKGTPDSSFRLGIKGGGCSGYSYVFQIDDEPAKENDIFWEIENVKIIVDKKSLTLLSGSRLRWKQSILFSGYEFDNPQEQSKCSCGYSFTVK